MFKRFWWVFLVIAVIGPVIGLMVAAVVTYVIPKKYESQATIEVRQGPMDGGSHQMTPQFFGTEFEIIISHDSLVKVTDKLELANKWGVDKETAIRILKGIVQTQNIRGTDLILVTVRHTNKADARDITAEIVRVYRDYRKEVSKRDLERNLAEWNKSVREQEDKVEERRKFLSEIEMAREKNITVDGTETLLHLSDSPNYIDAKNDFEKNQTVLSEMKLNLVRETMNGKLSEDSVIIHEEPQIGDFPVSPNVTLNLILGTALGFLVSPLLAIVVIVLLYLMLPAKEGGDAARPG